MKSEPLRTLKTARSAALEQAQRDLADALARADTAEQGLRLAQEAARHHRSHPPKNPAGRLSGAQAQRAHQRSLVYRAQTRERERAIAAARATLSAQSAAVARARTALQQAHAEAQVLERLAERKAHETRRRAARREQARDDDDRPSDQ